MRNNLKVGTSTLGFTTFLALACFVDLDASAASCSDGSTPLPNSGLCQADAAKLLPPEDQDFADGLSLFECKPVINDGMMLGNVILYRAAQCQGAPVTLEGSMGARSGSIDVWGGGMNADRLDDPYSPGKVVPSESNDPTDGMLRWARMSMEAEGFPADVIARCQPRQATDIAPDAWVIDEFADGQASSSDGPRSACGVYGYTEESEAYWRIVHGVAVFFDMGQDAYKDFDPKSLTMIAQGADGAWMVVDDVVAQAERETQALIDAGDYGVTNVANAVGAVETVYGEARGWTIFAGAVDGENAYCVGENDVDGIKLRLGYDNVQWQVALPQRTENEHFSQFEVDGQSWGMTGTSDGEWVFGWIGLPELDAIRNGNLMMLDVGRATFDYTLVGTAATITKIEECVSNNGNAG